MDRQWLTERPDFTRAHPAREQELLDNETAGESRVKPRARVLASLEARVGGKAVPLPKDMFDGQSFIGVSFVGIVASLNGRDGLFAQCAWFDDDEIDWCWAEITDIRSIEERRDPWFRGGARCLWLTTGFAEYAMVTPHREFDENWELTLEHRCLPRCDVWPRRGVCPEWWPLKWAGSWPYDSSVRERYAALVAQDPLAMLAQNLSLEPDTSRKTWLRLGPKGDVQLPGRPQNHLSQMSEWVLAPDAGMRKTQRRDDSDVEEHDAGGNGKAKGKRARPQRGQSSKRRAQGSGQQPLPN